MANREKITREERAKYVKSRTTTGKLKFNDGRLLFVRYGPMNAQYQSNDRAPVKRGIWVFPYPFSELFFTHHTNERLLPFRFNSSKQIMKKIKELGRDLTEDEEDAMYREINQYKEEHEEEYEEKKREIKKVLNRPKKMWYKGKFYCHFHPVTHYPDWDWFEWDNVREYAKVTEKFVGSNWSYDSLEVFIPM